MYGKIKYKGNTKYADLAPNGQADNTENYFDALDWALSNPNVCNIALTGSYGSGKSSIIRSYCRKHPGMKAVNISLANFADAYESGKNVTEYDDILQNAVLQQLFYQVKHHRIPQSRYRKLHKISLESIVFCVFAAVVLVYFAMLSAGFPASDWVGTAVSNIQNTLGIGAMAAVTLCFAWMIAVCGSLGIGIWMILSRVHVKEVKVGGEAISVSTAEEESVFNRNMDEILYFFEATKYRVVFIEDLDRFNNTNIFIKLRELNILLNHDEAIRSKVTFVYAIRDDMFIRNERTKFFEFIIPVIPVLNEANSVDKLISRWERDDKEYLDGTIDRDFLTQVAPYINDMRILNNTYNEFIVYTKTLKAKRENEKPLPLKDKQMFALMIYKNLYPKQFAELQNGGGLLGRVFSHKKEFAEEYRQTLTDRQKDVTNLLKHADSDTLFTVRELKAAMLECMTGGKGPFRYISTNGGTLDYEDIMQKDFDLEKLRANGTVCYYSGSYSNSVAFNGEARFVGAKDYPSRAKEILAKNPETKQSYQNEIEELDKEIRALGSMRLREMIEKYQLEKVLPDEALDNKLLVFLLRNGLIDEEYSNYINYFYGNSITLSDKNFIMSVRNFEALPFDYKLERTRQVADQLVDYEFEQKEIFNFDLLDYMLSEEIDSPKARILFRQLADEKDATWNFIDEYFNREKLDDKGKFIEQLCKTWTGIWDYIYDNAVLTKERKDRYLVWILNTLPAERIGEINSNGNIKKYFEETPDILKRISNVDCNKLEEVIEECDIYFENLYGDGADREIFDWIIIEKGRYKNTLKMLQCIFGIYAPDKVNRLLASNYTTILALNYECLSAHIREKIDDYVKDIVLGIETNTEESLEAVLDLLGRKLSVENAVSLIKKENIILDSLERYEWDSIEKNYEKSEFIAILDEWIVQDKVQPGWKNLHWYWVYNGVNDKYAQWLENNIDVITFEKCPSDMDPALISETLESNKLSAEATGKFAMAVKDIEVGIAISKLDEEHIRELTSINFFISSNELSKAVKSSHPEIWMDYLKAYAGDFARDMKTRDWSCDEIEALLESDRVDDNKKIKLIADSGLTEYSEQIALLVRNTSVHISKEMFHMAWNALKEEEKYELLIKNIWQLTNEEIESCFKQLGPDYQKLTDRTKRHEERLFDTEYNRKLLSELSASDYITSQWEKRKLVYDTKTKTSREIGYLYCRIKRA